MSAIFGSLNTNDSDYVFSATVGQRAIYDVAMNYVNEKNTELNAAYGLFIWMTTSDHSFRYYLPGDGFLQRRSTQGRYGAIKAYGSWDVGFPLEDFGAMISGNDVDLAYMTVGALDRHISTVVQQNTNTVRWEMLHRLFDNVQLTHHDERWGDVTVEPLANGDTVVYPPVTSGDADPTEAIEDHYVESGFLYTAIDDTHDPWDGTGTTSGVGIVEDLSQHFGGASNEEPIISFVNKAEVPYIVGLTDVVDAAERYIVEGQDTAIAQGPGVSFPGRLVGRHRDGAWIVNWDFIPAHYILSVWLNTDAPLVKRVDDPSTGLPTDLALVARDQEFPFQDSVWRHRFGFGCGNRLAAHVMELGNGGSYTRPTYYD